MGLAALPFDSQVLAGHIAQAGVPLLAVPFDVQVLGLVAILGPLLFGPNITPIG